ncbi:SusC/RagA family protein [Alistipes sp. An54]|uniref:SusC/RagA family TonB-linked outer membrane protein n=1 Tax=Alistipes sp. An54 TaxID=1965645 RepID=UPI000B3A4A15|nr:TonB-dependent receptor [Alistipes sp. An54]OUN76082.1 SusC/RagA family protein [Alistipes sp. An54]
MKFSGQTDGIVPKGRCLLVKFVSLVVSLFVAGQVLAANPPVTLHLKDVSVAELLRQIESQGQYTFAYNNADIDLTRVVSVDAEAWPVERVITTCIPNVQVLVERNKVILTPVRSAGAQQPHKISGKVSETTGAPIVGATVIYKDGSTVKGTTSSVNGEFAFEELTPSDQATLEVSFIGYDTYRMPVGSRTFFDVKLATSQQSIDEVVVVGYGVQKKANLTGAVATVSQKELKDRPVANVGRALQGVIPNLNVTLSSGQPGAGASYNIRGTTSPNGGSPLILIDGVETYPERINSNDIESITVLKDASSAAIYGARGAFGVILITTKSGRYNEKAEVSYNGYFSVSSPTTSTDYETRGYYSAKIADFFMMSSQNTPYTSYTESDYRALWERRNDRTENPARPWVITDTRNGRKQYVYLANFDWYNYLYDDSRPTWDHNINIRGGTKSLSYMVSGRYYQQKGINRLAPDMFKSYNFRVKLQAEIRPWLTISSNTKFFQSNYRYYGYEDEYNNFRKPTLHALASFVPVNPDGTAVSHTSMTNSSSHYIMDGYNAMMQKGKSFGNKKTQEITTTFEATFKLHKNFNVKADFSYTQGYLHNDYRSVNVEYSQYPGVIQTEPEGNFPNSYKEVVWDQNYYVADVYGTYNKSFGGKHNFTAIVGYNYEAKYYRDLTAANDGLLSEDLSDFNLAKGTTNFTLNGGRNEYAIMGWFYRVAYDYKGKYLAEVNGRYDGTSRFPRGKRYGFFPSFSLAYRISEEPFFEPLRKTIDNLKIRFSYGSLGNQQIGYYDFIQTITTKGSMSGYSFDGVTLGQHATVSDPVSGDQTWEKVISKNLGVDLNLFSNRLSLTADFYIRDTKGILGKGRSLPSIYGASEPQVNANDLRTKGYELSLGWRDSFKLAGSTFSYGIVGTLSDYTARYTSCDNPSGLISDPYEGKRYGEIWGYKVDGLFRTDEEAADYASQIDLSTVMAGCYSATGTYGKGVRAGDIKYLDLDGNHIVNGGKGTLEDSGDRRVIGNSTPRYQYGATFNFSWYGFDFSIFFQGLGHMDWYPGADNLRFWGPYSRPYATFIPRNFMSQVWSEDNPDAYFPRARAYTSLSSTQGTAYYTNDRYLQNLAYCRLKNLTIGYTIPRQLTSKVGIKECRIYFSGENLVTWTALKSDFLDPEQAAADSDKKSNVYPWCQTFSVGLNLTF